MSQPINDNFDLLAGLPIRTDDRHETITGRDNIPSTKRYTGRLCYVEQTQTLYMLVGGILNENWQPISGKTGVNEVSIYLVENYPFLWQKGRSDAGVDNGNNIMEAGDIIMLGYCNYNDGSGYKNTLVRLAKYVSGDATSISSYEVLIYDTTGVSNFKNDVRLPNISEDLTTTKVAVLDSDSKLSYVNKIPASLLPPIAITSVIPVTETTIADFAANSGSYTFEQGDVLILDNGNGSYYMYNGGTKTDVSAYNEITQSDELNKKLDKTGGVLTGDLTFESISTESKKIIQTSAFGGKNYETWVYSKNGNLYLVVENKTDNISSAFLFTSLGTFRPLATDTQDLGADALRWRNIYSTNFLGKFNGKNITHVKATSNTDAGNKGVAVGDIYTNQTTGILTERLASDVPVQSRTMDDPTTQTSASLNSAFPFAENPVGTTVTNINALQLFMYVRISELLWRVIALGSTI